MELVAVDATERACAAKSLKGKMGLQVDQQGVGISITGSNL